MEQVLEELGYIQASTASSHSPELTKAPRKVVREARAAQSCCRAAPSSSSMLQPSLGDPGRL